ncbi:hypothetical protein F5Y15DRAFT_412538 [Xylariaceae sp. FL0016]|nr:hypothetical protein F5Y15DRAFT_412538 [Xylariaceae sp. FL0016]
MPARSGISVRRVASQRHPSNEENGGHVENSGIPQSKGTSRDRSRDAWVAKRAFSGSKRATAPIIVTSSLTHNDVLRPLPPLPQEIPRSSESSWSSCDHHADCDCPYLHRRRGSPLCSISSKGHQSEESLESSRATSYVPDELSLQESPKHQIARASSIQYKQESSDSTIDFMEALFEQLENKGTAPKEAQAPQQRNSSSRFSDNIQQLIQETDEAFKAVGGALAEVKLIEFNFNDDTNAKIATPDLSPILKPPPPPKDSSPKTQGPQLSKPLPPIGTPSIAPASPKRVPSVTRERRKSRKAKAMKTQRKAAASKPAARTGPRWTLTDNVSELLTNTGKLFHKIEADEMITPSQIEEYKLRRISESQAQKSTETLNNDTVETPIEPFHLEDLPLRIGSAGVKLCTETPADKKAAATFGEDVVARDFSLEKRHDELGNFPLAGTSKSPRLATQKTNTFTTPPIKQAQRFTPPRRQMTELPSIPEVSVTPAPNDELFFSNNAGVTHDSVADSKYVFLQSPPCSVTIPTFRHGPIRLAKSDLEDLRPEVKIDAEDGLDWTAFQMAILGGAGDWFTDSDDTIRRREAEEVADLADWWESWNFNSPGGLVKNSFEAPSPTSTTSGEDFSDVSYSEIENDNPYSPHHDWQDEKRRAVFQAHKLPGLHVSLDGRPPKKLGGIDSGEKQLAANRSSLASLPQSPMLDLRVIRSEQGDDLDVVPMGYNLGHDLGDFLKWEAEHAYAGDFC